MVESNLPEYDEACMARYAAQYCEDAGSGLLGPVSHEESGGCLEAARKYREIETDMIKRGMEKSAVLPGNEKCPRRT
jgi:hypothetical protein